MSCVRSERRCVGAVNVSGPVRRAPMRHRDARVDGPVAFDTKYHYQKRQDHDQRQRSHARRWRHPVGLHERFFVVKLLILKRVKISESTDMLREVTPVLRRRKQYVTHRHRARLNTIGTLKTVSGDKWKRCSSRP